LTTPAPSSHERHAGPGHAWGLGSPGTRPEAACQLGYQEADAALGCWYRMTGFGRAGRAVMRHGGLVRPDKRAVLIAVVAVSAGVLLGYWAGAVPGVAAALAGLVPAAVLQIAMTRQGSVNERRARRAAAEASYAARMITVAAADAPGNAAGDGVARYLRPEAEVVRFWPRPELEELAR
jgi:hypothetical protein